MAETLALSTPVPTVVDPAATVDAVVSVYLNTTTDAAGRHIGTLDGYRPDHTLELALEYRMQLVPTTVGISAALERVFFDLNVGDDPAFVATPKAAVLQYRAAGHRSLSVGDVVEVHGSWYAVDRCGFRQV